LFDAKKKKKREKGKKRASRVAPRGKDETKERVFSVVFLRALCPVRTAQTNKQKRETEREEHKREERMSSILFEDIFDVKDIDKDGKKFDKGVAFFCLLLWFYFCLILLLQFFFFLFLQ
jgi:hypothetical protein